MLIKGSEIRKLIREELRRSMVREGDTDGDGIEDDEEVDVYDTDPNVFDTDGGGEGDGAEVENGLDPLNPADDSDDAESDEPAAADAPPTTPSTSGPGSATGSTKKGTCNPAVREIQKIIGTKPDCIWGGNTQEKFEQFINTFELKLEDASNSVISLDDVKKSWSKTGPKIKSIDGNPIAGYKGTATGLLVFLKDMQRFQSDAKNKTGFADTGTGAEVEDMSADSGTAQLNKNVVSIINMVLAGGHPFPANLSNERAMMTSIMARYSTKEDAAKAIIDVVGDVLTNGDFDTASDATKNAIDSLSDKQVKRKYPDEMKAISAAVIKLNKDLKESRIRRLVREELLRATASSRSFTRR